MFIMHLALAIIIGYLFGSVPFSLVIGKVFYNTDVRQYGSGNLGGTNTGRVLGKKAGLSVMILDIFKSFIVMWVISLFTHEPLILLAGGFFSAIGHAYPLFANFKGGKSVATHYGFHLGVCFFLFNHTYYSLMIAAIVFFITLYLTKMVSLSSMLSTSIGSLSAFYFGRNYPLAAIALCIIAIFIIIRHKANIQRIKANTESKVTWL